MKLTRAAYYAIRAVVYIAKVEHKSKAKKKEAPGPIASHDIARAINITRERFLLKVLKPLVQHQILRSIKGPNGGYSLARPAEEISLLEVIEAADGAPIVGSAPYDAGTADAALIRRLDNICKQVAEQTRKHLSKTSIADLA